MSVKFHVCYGQLRVCVVFCFFKQKTAYEMRISDWSSDVCSSDLIALKGEAIGLAIMTELPLVIVNSQRGGPSTGLPTKTEQSDLYQAVYGRNGDAPLP